jgi:hypothetical protein
MGDYAEIPDLVYAHVFLVSSWSKPRLLSSH